MRVLSASDPGGSGPAAAGSARHYLACDLGAESGRVMLGSLDGGSVRLEEIHRFPNSPRKEGESLHWDIEQLVKEVKTGLRKGAERGLPPASIGTDAWGVDYVLLEEGGEAVQPVFHYRDPRAEQGVAAAYAKVDWETIYEETGIQFMPINTLYQLAAETPERLRQARWMLGIGDAFNYFLSGVAKADESFASTTQLYNPRACAWSKRLIQALKLPERLFPPIVPCGTRLGPLLPEIKEETGASDMEVIAACSHDTGAAVVAVPATGDDWAYISSGTWSLMGVELRGPIINDLCRDLNFTNEIGYGGSIRLLKNIVGLWVVQECRRAWAGEGNDYEYADLTRMAADAKPFGPLINPTDARFATPGNMPAKIADYCRETGQAPPHEPAEAVRCVLESLALIYGRTLRQIERLLGRKINRLHIVGGGSKNRLLNQFTANATGKAVLAGPAEATALGNVLVQAMALGHIESLETARRIVRESCNLETFTPQDETAWQQAAWQFEALP